MKLKLVVALLALSSVTFAQGNPHGGGRPSGVGNPGGMGSSAGVGNSAGMGSASTHGRPSDPGLAQPGGTDSRKTPSDILSRNTKLSGNLEKLLPAGTTAQQACSGFKNLGQCAAAIHVSNNLGISFDDLKAKMTGDNQVSLGKAIGELKPTVDAKAESKKAKKQADADLKASS